MHNTFKNYTHDDNRLGMNSMADDRTLVHLLSLFISYSLLCRMANLCLYCFDAVSWAAGRASGL